MFVATVILSVLLALAFAGAGVPKILAQPKMVEAAAHVGFPSARFASSAWSRSPPRRAC